LHIIMHYTHPALPTPLSYTKHICVSGGKMAQDVYNSAKLNSQQISVYLVKGT